MFIVMSILGGCFTILRSPMRMHSFRHLSSVQGSSVQPRRLLKQVKTAHSIWEATVKPGDIVVDATCGRGYDSLALARLALLEDKGHLYCIDIQAEAIASTRSTLSNGGVSDLRIKFLHSSHESFPSCILPGTVALVAYNLGYLPLSDKSVITTAASSIRSFTLALPLLRPQGALSIAAYRGHKGGLEEYNEIVAYIGGLDQSKYAVSVHANTAAALSPVLFIIRKLEEP